MEQRSSAVEAAAAAAASERLGKPAIASVPLANTDRLDSVDAHVEPAGVDFPAAAELVLVGSCAESSEEINLKRFYFEILTFDSPSNQLSSGSQMSATADLAGL